MAVFKIVPVGENHSLKAKLNYILNPESTSPELVFTNFLSATDPYDEIYDTREKVLSIAKK